MNKSLVVLIALITWTCANENQNPQHLVNQAIEASGGNNLDKSSVEFEFRSKEYGARIDGGKFEYVRLFKDSLGLIRDVLNNDGFKREIDGKVVEIPDTMSTKYSHALNSVIYFALLPYGLNDPAVIKKYMGKKNLRDKSYHKIKVSFNQEGGGDDYQDEFIYWINTKNNIVDYLAYEYHTDESGKRFRVAYNERWVDEIRFVDYINFEPTEEISLDNIDDAFLNGKLKELSRIELKKVKIYKD